MADKKFSTKSIATVAVVAVFLGFQMYLALVRQLPPLQQSPLHLILALTLIYLYYPANKKHPEVKWPLIIDAVIFAGIAFMLYYVITNSQRLIDHVSFIDPVLTLDKVFMVVTILLLLEAVRRTLGNVLVIFIIAFIIYAWIAPYCPGIFFTKGKTASRFLSQFTEGMTMGESGVFGTPLYTSASCLFYFILFGVFFSRCGGGQLLIDCGMKFSNKSSGGPAKAAVISSGLMGMISGSAVANVSTTGVITIPMMKKIGYEPHEAGAIEAVASTGGQIMPPIMGIGAFIMAEMLGVNYLSIAKSAILPAVAYYLAVFVLVSMLARKRAVKAGSPDVEIKVEQKILPRLYLLLPAILLVVWIIRGNSLMRSGMVGIFSCLVCNVISYFVNGKRNFIGLKELGKCCVQGTKQAAEIAIPTAACGIIINVVTMQTSLATNLTSVVGGLGQSYLFLALLVAMAGCMLLGMALPTVAAYLVGVILFVPVIRSLGVSALCANMFVFYFGIMAQITPPVCVASYTAAGIAGASAMKTGWTGMTYALVGFLAPFVFVFNPAILLEGSVLEIITGAAQLFIGSYVLAVAVAGYFRNALNMWERLILVACAISMISPEMVSTVVGVAVAAGLLLLNTRRGAAKPQISA
ncbi:MAG: TRAP transporter fused permease subunit [Clostridia bacterium]|nr:TRAP transporter fused permease subunit [Clostridia bacterium]